MLNSHDSDADLVQQLRAGRPEALTEIFRRHWKPLYMTAVAKLNSHEQAEETVQELFTELWDKRQKLFSRAQEDMHLPAYLERAIKNKVLNLIRKKIYDRKYWDYIKSSLDTSGNPASELAEFNDLQEKLDSALDNLSGKTREIFVLHKLKGIPVLQISRKMKLSEKAVGYHLTKSVKELRLHLRDFI